MQSVSILFFHFSPVQVKTSFFTITIYTVYINGLCKFTLHAHFSPFQLVFSIPRSNPFPTFNCCMQNDIIAVLFCLSSFCKKPNVRKRWDIFGGPVKSAVGMLALGTLLGSFSWSFLVCYYKVCWPLPG